MSEDQLIQEVLNLYTVRYAKFTISRMDRNEITTIEISKEEKELPCYPLK